MFHGGRQRGSYRPVLRDEMIRKRSLLTLGNYGARRLVRSSPPVMSARIELWSLGFAAALHGALALAFPSTRALAASRPADGPWIDVELQGTEATDVTRISGASQSGSPSGAGSHVRAPRRVSEHGLRARKPEAIAPAPAVLAPSARNANDSATGDGQSETSVAAATGAGPAHEPATPRGRPAASTSVSRRARLLTPGACQRLFPREARDDAGAVVIELRVAETGEAFASSVLAELPQNQGFGRAAVACAKLLRFAPAEDALGMRTSSVSVVRLRFARGVVDSSG